MADNLFITATEARSGKSLVSLGLMEMLLRKINKVGFFRPIIYADPASGKRDNDIQLISSHFKLEIPYEKMYGYTTQETADLVSQGKETEILEGIIKKYNELKQTCDFVLCEGTDYPSSSAAFELDINAEISTNLGAPVLLVSKIRSFSNPTPACFSEMPKPPCKPSSPNSKRPASPEAHWLEAEP